MILSSMLAVMTMNISYFISVLAGVFAGELAVGRYAVLGEH
jgi:copper transporter 1